MARRKKSTRKRRRISPKKPTGKPAADLPVTVPPFGRNTNPEFGWNTNDQTANQIVRHYAERQRNLRTIATEFSSTPLALRNAPETIHAKMLTHIAAIEEITPQLPGVGHNKPPEPIEPQPLTSDEIAEIKIYVAVMNGLPAEPTQVPTLLGRAWERLKILGEKVLTQLATATVTVAVATLWREYGDHLIAAGKLIAEWIKALMHLS